MTQTALFGTPEDGPVGRARYDAVTFEVRWHWDSDTPQYWLDHRVVDAIGGQMIVEGSNRYTWKEADAVGDCGLAVRWLREARLYLATPTTAPARHR